MLGSTGVSVTCRTGNEVPFTSFHVIMITKKFAVRKIARQADARAVQREFRTADPSVAAFADGETGGERETPQRRIGGRAA